jgi:hypothetical protein
MKRVVLWLLMFFACAGGVPLFLAISGSTDATKPASPAVKQVKTEGAPVHVLEPTKVAPRILATSPATPPAVQAETSNPSAPQPSSSPLMPIQPTSPPMLVVIGDSSPLPVARDDIKTFSRRLYKDLAGRRLKLTAVGGQRFRIQTATALSQPEALRLCDSIKRRGLSCVLASG